MTPPQASSALPRLLLVDDDEISREVLSMMLGAHGFSIETAENGAEALLKLAASPVDAILMDTQMPGISGVALIDALRQKTPARIVAISGSEIPEAIRLASDGCLLKPVDAEDLVAILAMPAQEAKAPVCASHSGTAAIDPQTENPATYPATGQVIGPAVEPVIEPAVLGRLSAMMPTASLREIYDAVAADMKKRLILLEQAMDTGDSAEIARIAHSIKGGSAMVGFTLASKVASRLEISNRSETWPQELRRLQEALARLEGILSSSFPT